MAVAFTVPADVLGRLVARVGKVVERRNTIPILGNVVVTAEGDGRLAVEGTDLDIWARAETQPGTANVETPGAASVPAALLADILRKSTKGDLRFVSDGKMTKLGAGRAMFKLIELDPRDYPQAPAFGETAASFVLEPGQLRRIVSDTGFAISTEETRYYMNGVFLHAPDADGRLVAVATDGHRLSRLRQTVDGDLAGMPGIIVPRKTVGLFGLLADCCGDDETVGVGLNDRLVSFEAPGFRLISKLIDGTFPDYVRVIPTSDQVTIETEMEPKRLGEAVERVATISAERGRGIKLDFSGAVLSLSMAESASGEGRDELALAEPVEDGEIGFNASYLAGILDTFDTPFVRLTLRGPGSPAVITDPASDARLVLLMPMRV